MAKNSTQKQRDYITSLIDRIGVEKAYEAGAITIEMAFNAGRDKDEKPLRTAREVAQHCRSVATASQVITALKAIA